MAKKSRQNLKLFGDTGASSNFGQFGSQVAGSPVTSKNIATLQSLAAFDEGWQEAVAAGQAPYLQDMNTAFYVAYYELFYMFQEGIAEWDSDTEYWIGSIVKEPGTSQLFASLVDNNTNNALPTAPASDANWQYLSGVVGTNYAVGLPLEVPDGVVGTATNDSAAAGIVGEYLDSAVTSVNMPTSGQWGDMTSLSLGAGDWDVWTYGVFQNQGSSPGFADLGLSSHAGNDATGLTLGTTYVENTVVGVSAGAVSPLGAVSFRFSLAAPTTVYAKIRGNWSTTPPLMHGRLAARRVR